MLALTKKALTVGIIAGILVFVDGVITQLIGINGSFVWVSFISWTVFFGAKTIERLKAIPGYVIGFGLALAIINLGNYLHSIMHVTILGVTLASIVATFLINFICIYFEKLKKFYLDSINGIFVGIALTFSGLGVGLDTASLCDCGYMLFIIVIYGILGLLSGYFTIKINNV